MTDNISKQYFEVNFITNPNLRPENVKASEIADILKAIEGLVESQILAFNPQLKQEPVIIGFSNIKASSIDLEFRSPFPQYVLSAFNEIGSSVEKEDYSKLPPSCYKDLNTVVLFTRRQKCIAEFVHHNGKRNIITTITPDTRVERPPALRGETTVYAKVVRVGGKELKVEIETIDGLTLFCDASVEITTQLGSKLYQTVGLTGTAQWDLTLSSIEIFKISGVTEYEKVSLRQAFDELAKVTREYYKDVNDVDQYISNIRDQS